MNASQTVACRQNPEGGKGVSSRIFGGEYSRQQIQGHMLRDPGMLFNEVQQGGQPCWSGAEKWDLWSDRGGDWGTEPERPFWKLVGHLSGSHSRMTWLPYV